MSHHYSGPNIGFPPGDARLDLTDLYAFPKPGDSGKSMNFHPSVGLNPPGPTTTEPFAPEARYELEIDTDADAVADIRYEVSFASVEGGAQAAPGTGGKVIVEGVPVSTGREAYVTQAGDHRFLAGWRSDPFFFDVLGTINQFQFTTGDFFLDKDTCSIALEVPNCFLGPKEIGVWARTLIPKDSTGGGWIQAEAKQVAGRLLPDLLRYDPKRPASFPDNGRALSDDVSDLFLAILTNGKVTGDNVGSHHDLLDDFPYLGSPHIIYSK
jgi:hypothetical protein